MESRPETNRSGDKSAAETGCDNCGCFNNRENLVIDEGSGCWLCRDCQAEEESCGCADPD